MSLNGEKNLEVAVLLDFYSELLTEKQRDVIDLYYNEDLSLAEIAEHENITRQGVRDSIKRGEQVLFEMETALHLAEKSRRLEGVAQRLEEMAENFSPEDMRAAAAELRNIL